ncbi:MAG TPA: outer membrane beta-barrel protein [Terriglobia bacterium]|nr:outer membrane beta-barrel protein [Terriglobia bacterium]
MRKVLTFGSVLVFLAVLSVPKAYSQVELYGGYSHLSLSGTPSNIGSSSNGWAGGAYLHLLGPWGIEADYSNHYGVNPSLTLGGSPYYVPRLTQLYGPRFTLALPRIHPYVHALAGTVNGTAQTFTGRVSENAFGMAFGGGLNVKATRHIWLRLVQVDYLRAQFTNNSQNDTRVSAGLIFRFGEW